MILEAINWKFGRKKYKTSSAFYADLKEYNEILSPELDIDPSEKIVEASQIVINFDADWKDENASLSIDIKSQYNEPLTIGEVLYTLNEESFEFFQEEEIAYFKGIVEDDLEEIPPEYKLVAED